MTRVLLFMVSLGTALAVAGLRLEIAGLRRVRTARLFHFHMDEEPSAPSDEHEPFRGAGEGGAT